jgi:hypothetical protein
MARVDQSIESMTLGNIRELGVGPSFVSCRRRTLEGLPQIADAGRQAIVE